MNNAMKKVMHNTMNNAINHAMHNAINNAMNNANIQRLCKDSTMIMQRFYNDSTETSYFTY